MTNGQIMSFNTETDRKILDAINEKDLLKDWQRAELMGDIKHLVFHDLLTDEQKIISLKMLLEEDDEIQ